MAGSIMEKASNRHISFSSNLFRPQRYKSPLPYYPDSAHPSIEDRSTNQKLFSVLLQLNHVYRFQLLRLPGIWRREQVRISNKFELFPVPRRPSNELTIC
jgi:hypothetical protein